MLKENYIADYFYFSYKENLTSSLPARKEQQTPFNEFAWNLKLMEPFLKYDLHPCWTIPVVQGFVAEIRIKNKYFEWQYLNISRRSVFMSGITTSS